MWVFELVLLCSILCDCLHCFPGCWAQNLSCHSVCIYLHCSSYLMSLLCAACLIVCRVQVLLFISNWVLLFAKFSTVSWFAHCPAPHRERAASTAITHLPCSGVWQKMCRRCLHVVILPPIFSPIVIWLTSSCLLTYLAVLLVLFFFISLLFPPSSLTCLTLWFPFLNLSQCSCFLMKVQLPRLTFTLFQLQMFLSFPGFCPLDFYTACLLWELLIETVAEPKRSIKGWGSLVCPSILKAANSRLMNHINIPN